jgi:hypothetical protein
MSGASNAMNPKTIRARIRKKNYVHIRGRPLAPECHRNATYPLVRAVAGAAVDSKGMIA